MLTDSLISEIVKSFLPSAKIIRLTFFKVAKKHLFVLFCHGWRAQLSTARKPKHTAGPLILWPACCSVGLDVTLYSRRNTNLIINLCLTILKLRLLLHFSKSVERWDCSENERLRDTHHKNNKPQFGLEEADSTSSTGVLVSELTWPVAFHSLQDRLTSCRQQSISPAAA